MRYAMLNDGKIRYATKRVSYNGVSVYNPSEEILLAIGYKPVVITDRPDVEAGYFAKPAWEDTGTEIVQSWIVAEIDANEL